MKTKFWHRLIALILLVLSTLNSQVSTSFAQGTAFNYQGRLNDSGGPANGLYDVRFTVWDAPTNGDLIAGPLTNSATGVSNGLFAVTLDFGGGVFTGPDRWLQLDVRTNGNGAFVTLLPLQPIQPMPYAIMANTASNLIGTLPAAQLTGALPVGQLSGTVPLTQLPPGVVTNSSTSVVLSGTFSGNGAGLTNLTFLTGGNPIYMNFDSVNPGSGIDATAYLASFGITLTNVSQLGSVYVVGDTNYYGTGAVTAPSPHNFLLQSVSASSCSYTLDFSVPLQSVTFTRIAISGGFSTPIWTVTAYAGTNVVGSVGDPNIDGDTGQPAHTYTISGQGITSLIVSGNGMGFTAAASVPLDDFYMVPETLNVSGAITAISYSGNGSGLTSLNPTNLSSGTAGINISGNAATATSAGNAASALTANNLSGSFSGDVTGTQSATVVSTVSGVTAANVASGANAANAATSANTPNTIVERDASGNFSAGSVVLNSNLNLPGPTVTVYSGGGSFLRSDTNFNFFAGPSSGNLTTSGNRNVVNGAQAFQANTSGSANTVNGFQALANNNSGSANTVNGYQAMQANTSGSANTAIGLDALLNNKTGDNNIAIGDHAGFNIGFSSASGSNNIDIGNMGVITDTNIIRIGDRQTQTFIAGVINGNGGGLTNVSASQLGGTISLEQLPSAVVTNGASGVNISGTFTGNGSLLTNVPESWQTVSATSQTAASNQSYLLTNNALDTLTLPTSPNVGDVVTVTGVEINGWLVSPGGGQTIAGLVSVAGALWTEQTSAPISNYWNAVASSSDGQYLAAVAGYSTNSIYTGGVYASTNYGASWTQANTPTNVVWASVASSSDGSHLAALAYNSTNGWIYTSTNYGMTWTLQTAAPGLGVRNIASSSDGSYLAAVVDYGGIYTSTNYGSTWTQTSAPSNYWTCVTVSSDGSHLAAGANAFSIFPPFVSTGSIYISTNAGATWTQASAPNYGWACIASSSDGSHLMAGTPIWIVNTTNVIYTGIYASTNAGATWALTLGLESGSLYWKSLASSSNGSILEAVGNGIWASTNSGNTWAKQINSSTNQSWASVACSMDGNYLVAACNVGGIYTSSGGQSLSFAGFAGEKVQFQYIGNGLWQPLTTPASQVTGSGTFSGDGSGLTNLVNYVAKTGDNMTGPLTLGDGTILGNQAVTIWLTNSSGAVRSAGEIVIIGGANNSFTVTATGSSTAVLGVVYDASIPIGGIGRIAIGGVVQVLSAGATTRGQHVVTSSTSGKAGSDGTPTSGASIGKWLESGGAAGAWRALLK